MTAFTNSSSVSGKDHIAPTPAGAENITVRSTLSVLAADLVGTYTAMVGILPAGCLPVELEVDASDLDTGSGAASQVYSLGIGNLVNKDAAGATSAGVVADTLQSTLAADGGGAWGVTTAVKTAFDQKITRTLANMKAVTAVNYDRHVIMIVTTAPETAAAGTMGFTLTYRAA